MQEQIQKLRDAGFDDAQISEWINSHRDQAGVTAAPSENSAEADVPFSATPTAPPPGSQGGIAEYPQNIAEGLAAANSFLGSPVGHALEATGAAAYGGKKLVEAAKAFRGTPGPVVPTAPAPMAAPAPAPMAAPAPQAPAQVPQISSAKSIVQKLALDKIMRGAGAVAKMAGPATGMAMNLFGTSPEEIATLKAAEARRKQLGQ